MRKLLIMTALLFTFSLAPAMGSPVGAQETASSVAADLDGWWAGQLSASGYGYWSPGIVEVWGYQETACGPIDTGIGPAAYCPVDGTIYVVPGYGYGNAEWTPSSPMSGAITSSACWDRVATRRKRANSRRIVSAVRTCAARNCVGSSRREPGHEE